MESRGYFGGAMCRSISIAMFVALAHGFLFAQQPTSSFEPTQPQPERAKVYSVGPGVTAPELLPLDLPPITPEKCKKKFAGKVELSLLVDTAGRARNIMFLRPLGTEADRYALHIADADRFVPGTADGKPVVVADSLEVKIQSCLVESKDGAGNKSYALKLRSAPVQELRIFTSSQSDAVLSSANSSWKDTDADNAPIFKVGGGIAPPVLLFQPEAEFSDEAREKKISGTCWFSFVVDAQGMPHNLQETQKLGYGLDEKAFEAVARYRFKPATKN
jgi:hypothetical protein